MERNIRKTNSEELTFDSIEDQINHKKGEIILHFSGALNEKRLPFYESSIDKEVVESISDDPDLKENINSFLKSDKKELIGSKITQKLAIEMFKKIQEKDFLETDNGYIIYRSYKEMMDNANISNLNRLCKFECNNDVIKNCYSYLIISIDPNLSGVIDISEFLTEMLKASNISIIPDIVECKNELNEISKESNQEIEKNNNDTIKKIEKSSTSNVWKIYKSSYNYVKSKIVNNPIGSSIQVALFSGCILFTGKFILIPSVIKGAELLNNNVFSEKVTILDNTKEILDTDSDKKNDIEKKNIFGDFFLSLGKWINEKFN